MLPSDVKTSEMGNGKKPAVFPWTHEQEQLLAEWAEKATCYRWLHGRSEKSYRTKNYTFTIPVIILSTLTGTANFAMDSFVPDDYKQLAMACVGSVNIFAGILSTLQNFLRYAELMESHRLSEVQWSKFGRNIEVELALDPKRRKPAHEFLEVCRAEYDRLIEQSPTIDDAVIKQFKRNFKKVEVKVPDMCNGLDPVKIFEPTKEAKLEQVMTNVAGSLLTHKKKSHPYSHSRDVRPQLTPSNDVLELDVVHPPVSDTIEEQQRATINDLKALQSFNRVSSLRRTTGLSDRRPDIEEGNVRVTEAKATDEATETTEATEATETTEATDEATETTEAETTEAETTEAETTEAETTEAETTETTKETTETTKETDDIATSES
jgi:hypothetical protein